MIKNYKLLRELDNEFIRNNKLTHKKAFQVFEAMWKYAVNMGVSLFADSGQEIEEVIEFKKRINAGFLSKK